MTAEWPSDAKLILFSRKHAQNARLISAETVSIARPRRVKTHPDPDPEVVVLMTELANVVKFYSQSLLNERISWNYESK